jgi:hypothetical protein
MRQKQSVVFVVMSDIPVDGTLDKRAVQSNYCLGELSTVACVVWQRAISLQRRCELIQSVSAEEYCNRGQTRPLDNHRYLFGRLFWTVRVGVWIGCRLHHHHPIAIRLGLGLRSALYEDGYSI